MQDRFYRVRSIFCALWLIALCGSAPAQQAGSELKFDIDVRLKTARVVLNLDHLAYAGKEPFGLLYARIMQEQFSADKTDWQVIGIFHGAAGFWSLNDDAYNRVRRTKSGNPYARQIAVLQKGGVQFEVCGQTARDNKWVNADFLPGIAVNSGANFRIIQLVQDGFVQIQP
ncbi:MAG: DsrE family protein [Pseudorhodoplanes sp.]|uniref:DsrE family protein n=1 Tax=Pseudorhodoplanes sp. TaxID=1934341 RepID=UPI003D10860B